MKYQIGEFSRITQLSIKALRHYHKLDILVPQKIDEGTKYRYYTEKQIERAKAIKMLKKMDFSLLEIAKILKDCEEDADVIKYLYVKSGEIQEKISAYRKMQKEIEHIINQKTMSTTNNSTNTIEIKDIEDINIASIRYKGRYQDMGKYIGKLFKACRGKASGTPFALYYDEGYKEKDADIEVCLPVKSEVKAQGINYRTLEGGKAYSLIHKGPYDNLGESYKKIFDRIKEDQAKIKAPGREIYLKGPGMIFKGNPEKYLTEIQIMIDESM